jgi:hypothetical protein
MARKALLACALSVICLTHTALAGDRQWGPWSSPSKPELVGADFTHDDGGKLLIYCNKSKNLISYIFNEPRAHWQEGSKIPLKVRADDESETTSNGIAINSAALLVAEEATFDLSTMGQGAVWFAIGAGGYARIFLAEGFKKFTEPVLRACGDHR